MSARSKKLASSAGSHDRSALIQWLALVVFAILGLIAAFVLFDGDSGGGNSGAPASVPQA
ncbi:MAG: hypothetical protein WBM50_08660 [Acidimicrobiales bacterium]